MRLKDTCEENEIWTYLKFSQVLFVPESLEEKKKEGKKGKNSVLVITIMFNHGSFLCDKSLAAGLLKRYKVFASAYSAK